MIETLTTLAHQLHAKDETIKELKTKAEYCDSILQSKEAIPVTLIAKDYDMSAATFNKLLVGLKI